MLWLCHQQPSGCSVCLVTDGFMEAGVSRCVFTSSDLSDIEYIYSNYYNKVELVRFNSTVGKFVGYTEYGMKNAENWNNDPSVLARRKNAKERYCKHNIDIDYQSALDKSVWSLYGVLTPCSNFFISNSTLSFSLSKDNLANSRSVSPLSFTIACSKATRSAPPAGGHHTAMLMCSVYGFYPINIHVVWLRDGQEVTSDVTATDELADGDWYYQIHSHLEYTPRSGEKISCMVHHASLQAPLVKVWDPSMPESERNKIAIGASGLVLGLVLSLAGFIYYRRKVTGRILVPTN
ncbi:H-2 class II histocompatibility antigen, E-S beta chain-like [Diretmus argenteus]